MSNDVKTAIMLIGIYNKFDLKNSQIKTIHYTKMFVQIEIIEKK